MVTVFKINREHLKHLEPLDAGKIHGTLKTAGIEPSVDWGGVITDDEKVIIVYYSPPIPIGKIADALKVDASYLVKAREFNDQGKGRYLLYEGTTKKGTYERIEVNIEE
jgi:hypothetical protein